MTVTPARGRGVNTRYSFKSTLRAVGVSAPKAPRNPPPFPTENPHETACETPTKSPEKPPQTTATTSLKNLSDVEHTEQRALTLFAAPAPSTSAFDEWWAVYPRKAAKKAANKLFAGILKRGEARADQLIAGAKRYARSETVARGYIKNPTTWLNGACWADEPEPSRRGAGQPWSALDQSLEFLVDREDPQ